MNQCSECSFVKKIGAAYECRRYPPTPMVMPKQSAQFANRYPHVHGNDFCGEFKVVTNNESEA